MYIIIYHLLDTCGLLFVISLDFEALCVILQACFIMPPSHTFTVKLSRKSHKRFFFEWDVATSWLLRGLCGDKLTGNYVFVMGSTWRLLESCHIHICFVTATYIQ